MNPVLLQPSSPEPTAGSVVLTNSLTGTVWQRFYSDARWHSVTGEVCDWSELFVNKAGRPRTVHLVLSAPPESSS